MNSIKTIRTGGDQIFVSFPVKRGGSGYANISDVAAFALLDDGGATKVLAPSGAELLVSATPSEILEAIPNYFVRVTLPSGGSEPASAVYLNPSSIIGFAATPAGTIIFSTAFPVPMPVLETVDKLADLLEGTKVAEPVAVAA